MDTIRIHEKTTLSAQKYFSGNFYFLAWILGPASLIFITTNLTISVFLFSYSLLAFTTSYKVEIDPAQKTIKEYLSLLGFKVSLETNHYDVLTKIFLNSTTYSQTVNSKASSYQVRGKLYRLYLETDTGKYFLGERTSHMRAIAKANRISGKFELPVEDFS